MRSPIPEHAFILRQLTEPGWQIHQSSLTISLNDRIGRPRKIINSRTLKALLDRGWILREEGSRYRLSDLGRAAIAEKAHR